MPVRKKIHFQIDMNMIHIYCIKWMWEISNVFNKMFSFVPWILRLYAIVNHINLIFFILEN